MKIGRVSEEETAALATDGRRIRAMLRWRPGEGARELLERLEAALEAVAAPRGKLVDEFGADWVLQQSPKASGI